MSILLYAKRIYFDPAPGLRAQGALRAEGAKGSEKSMISLENRDQVGVYALICKSNPKVLLRQFCVPRVSDVRLHAACLSS